MSSIIKVDNIQNQCGANIIKEDSNTITLGASGDTVTLASGASQTGFGRTGTVDWDTTPKTASFTADSGDGYFVNTTSGAITVTLPAGSANAIVSLADYAATWQTNNVTVTPNGTDKIGGINSNAVLNTEGQSVTFVFVDSTQGWVNVSDSTSNVRAVDFTEATGGTVVTCGNYKIHIFTGPGTFCVSSIGTGCNPSSADYLVVAGGGGSNYGAGGAGGFRNSVTCAGTLPLSVTGFPITVGGGGAGAPSGCAARGSQSIFSTITSTGGGGSGSATPASTSSANAPGGSGAGAPGFDFPTSPSPIIHQIGGAGNTPPVSPPQGKNGGANPSPGTFNMGGTGGAGATVCGGDETSPEPAGTKGANGGAGATTSITGSPVAYGGGGGGSGYNCAGAAGTGGGGTGSTFPSVAGTSGTANTGGGGGGGGSGNNHPTATPGGAGGSGVVIIRYKFQ